MSGGIFKGKLVYDSTTPSDGDSVAAFLRTGSGALTSTGAAGALDVNITNSLTVNVDGDYDGATNATPDSVGIIAHDRGAAPDQTAQNVRPTGAAASSDNVVAANTFGLDTNAFHMGFDGSAWDRLTATISSRLDTTPHGHVADDAADTGNPIKIGSRVVDGVLPAISATGDRADLIFDMYRRPYMNVSPNAAGSNTAVTVDDTAGGVVLFASPLEGRSRVQVQNNDNKEMYLGFGTVTIANGIRVDAGATWTEMLGPDLILKAIRGTGETGPVIVMQLA